MAELTRLANIPFDLQITICILLRLIDILALRKTCKAFELITRQRVVWLAVFHRVCLDNTLFLPSFPIPDMSDLELEQAAIAPYRWIKLSGGFKKRHPGDTILWPRKARIFENLTSSPYLFLVPGGRYLVVATDKGLFVWDLDYVSNTYCTLIASGGVGLKVGDPHYESFCMVQATPDNMGLIILVCNMNRNITIYEIYPQSETPLLTQIAHCSMLGAAHLLPNTLVFRSFYGNRIVFRFWDYRENYSTCFSADVAVNKFQNSFATETAIIIFCEDGILVWAIPPRLPHSPDHFLDDNPTHLPPLFRIPFPDDRVYHDILYTETISSWYFGSWESIYFDFLRSHSKLDRFKLIVKPDLSDASLHVIKSSELTPFNFKNVSFQRYRICEDTPVSFWSKPRLAPNPKCGVYTGFTTARFTCDVAVNHSSAKSLCPASGRLVYFAYDVRNNDGGVVVVLF